MDFEHELINILLNDPLGLLIIKPKAIPHGPDERLIKSFEEINEFIDKNDCEPREGNDIHERLLFSRLGHLKNDHSKTVILQKYDRHNLLGTVKELQSVDDVLGSDPLGLLNTPDEGIFDHKFIKSITNREDADFVATRKECKDFDKFDLLFKQIHSDLTSKRRKLLPYGEKQLEPGNFFVQNGMLLYLESVKNLVKDKFDKYDGRTKVIFENGTESSMKYRSLGKILLLDGQAVSAPRESCEQESKIDNDDLETGFIYVLKSCSQDPEIVKIKDLYKIGYSSQSVADRIENAASDPTYLMADVESIAEFKTYNVNPQKLELLMHTFFSRARLNMDVFGEANKRYSPREWFIVPIKEIGTAIELIASGEIINYVYNANRMRIERK